MPSKCFASWASPNWTRPPRRRNRNRSCSDQPQNPPPYLLGVTGHNVKHALELDHDGQSDAGFILSQVGEPNATVAAAGCRREQATSRRAVIARVLSWKTVIAARRRDSAPTAVVGLIRVTIAVLPAEGNVLFGHPVPIDGGIQSVA